SARTEPGRSVTVTASPERCARRINGMRTGPPRPDTRRLSSGSANAFIDRLPGWLRARTFGKIFETICHQVYLALTYESMGGRLMTARSAPPREAGMLLIDAHHHVWDLSRAEYPWLGPDLGVLNRDHRIDELLPM